MLRIFLVVTLLLGLSACSGTPEWKAIYSTDQENLEPPKLEVPPDLDKPVTSNDLDVPNIKTRGSTYSAYTHSDTSSMSKNLLANVPGIKVKRDGAMRWLEVEASADELWSQLKIFFHKVGFKIENENKALGFMETNWVESHDALPSNWFMEWIEKLYSSGLMDKYRARLEVTDNPKITLLYITHQGMAEKSTDVSAADTADIWWQPRESDPELEAEMLQRFLIFKNMDKKMAKELFANNYEQRATLIEKDGIKILNVRESFARTWRRTGLALDRMGLLVEDKNRSAGTYYIQLSENFLKRSREEKGWFESLFADKQESLATRYVLNVTDKNATTEMSLIEPDGKQADQKFVEKFLSEIKVHLE